MSIFRANVDRLVGYVPGEQPQEGGWVKLNTNENPYPPSPRVLQAICDAANDSLRLYPDPLAKKFCDAAAELFGVDPDWILPANGSDENLTIIMRSFVDPGELVLTPYPSYTLYETLVDIQAGRHARLPLDADWSFDFAACATLLTGAKLAFVPNPNSPSGNLWEAGEVLSLVPPRGLLVLDEAYGDFCDEPHRGEILREPGGDRIIITRTLSKSYSLAGIRLGFAIAHPDLIAGMRKVKDSYNCDALSLAAATAALGNQDWMRQNAARIRSTRGRLTDELRTLGFDVVDSQANFVWAHADPEQGLPTNGEVFERLKDRRILVRYMTFPEVAHAAGGELTGLRITVGTDQETDALLAALREIV